VSKGRNLSIRQVLASQIALAIDTVPHGGDMGHTIEDILRNVLREYIPKRFSVEKGFVRSLGREMTPEELKWKSHSVDILFTHGDSGLVLSSQPNTKVFPLESVLGFMEVTKTIDRQKLHDDFQKVRELKHQVRRYCWCSLAKAQELGVLKLEDYCAKMNMPLEVASRFARNYRVVVPYNDLEPRFYYFAYSTRWSDPETICQNIYEASEEFGVQLHGMLILDRGLFRREIGSQQVVYNYIEELDEAFALFMHSLIDSLMTFAKIPEGTSIPLDIYQGVTHSKYAAYIPTPIASSQQ
jgi:hypothetical protein